LPTCCKWQTFPRRWSSAFRSPLDIQHRHAKSIAAVLDTDRKGILRRAEKLRAQERPKAAAAVVAALVGATNEATEPTHRIH
jgi:hypothetical protein